MGLDAFNSSMCLSLRQNAAATQAREKTVTGNGVYLINTNRSTRTQAHTHTVAFNQSDLIEKAASVMHSPRGETPEISIPGNNRFIHFSLLTHWTARTSIPLVLYIMQWRSKTRSARWRNFSYLFQYICNSICTFPGEWLSASTHSLAK